MINEITTKLVDQHEEFLASIFRDFGIDTNKNMESIKEELKRNNMKFEFGEGTRVDIKENKAEKTLKLNGSTIAKFSSYIKNGEIVMDWEKLYVNSDIDKLIKKSSEEIDECIKNQDIIVKEKGYPYFAPGNGTCYRCNRNIYQNYMIEGKVSKGHGNEFVTGCPHCHRSYCE